MGYDLRQTGTGGINFVDEASSATMSIVGALHWNVNRAPTNTTFVGTLPANAKIIDVIITVPVVSNAATTATVSVGLNGGSNTTFSAAQDVKAAIGNFRPTATAGWAVSTAKQDISCTYTETGAASTAGTITATVIYVVL
jgi:uncharacterized protein YcnI